MWTERVDMDTGEVYRFDCFEDFVTAQPLAGLGADMAKLKAVCEDDPDALVMLRKAVVKPVGINQHTEGSYNVTTHDVLRGNTKSYTLSRLQKHRPDLYERVKAGELTANAAAVEAGFRRKPEPLQQFANLWAKMCPEERVAVEDIIANWRRRRRAWVPFGGWEPRPGYRWESFASNIPGPGTPAVRPLPAGSERRPHQVRGKSLPREPGRWEFSPSGVRPPLSWRSGPEPLKTGGSVIGRAPGHRWGVPYRSNRPWTILWNYIKSFQPW